jgi:hypothetical protein
MKGHLRLPEKGGRIFHLIVEVGFSTTVQRL